MLIIQVDAAHSKNRQLRAMECRGWDLPTKKERTVNDVCQALWIEIRGMRTLSALGRWDGH